LSQKILEKSKQAIFLSLFLSSQAFENNFEAILNFNGTKGYLFYSNSLRINRIRMWAAIRRPEETKQYEMQAYIYTGKCS